MRRKHERDDAEQSREARDSPLLIERAIHLLLQRPDGRHGQVRIGLGERPLQLRLEGPWRHVGDQQQSAHEVRLKLQALHHRVRILDRLRQRDEEHRPRRLVEREPRELRITHDADDAERVDVLRQIEAEAPIERILVALEKPPDEGFVHDGDRLRRARCPRQ